MFYRYSVTKVGNFFLKNRTFNALYRLQWTRPGGHGSGVKIGLYLFLIMESSHELCIAWYQAARSKLLT